MCDVPRCDDLAGGATGASAASVLVVVLRGVSQAAAASRLPRTLALLASLDNVTHVSTPLPGARSLSGGGAAALRALFSGASRGGGRGGGGGGGGRLWDIYRAWGYVTAFAEAECSGVANVAAGLGSPESLSHAGEIGVVDHRAVEPFCGLDTQLRARATLADAGPRGRELSPNSSVAAGGSRRRALPGGGVCVGQAPAYAHVLNYTRGLMRGSRRRPLYGALPKLSVAVLPAMPRRALRQADALLRSLLRSAIAARPATALLLVADGSTPYRRSVARPHGKGGAGGGLPRAATVASKADPEPSRASPAALLRLPLPLLHLALPLSTTPPHAVAALRANAASRVPVSAADVHATLRSLPRLRVTDASAARGTAASAGVGGSSLLELLPAGRSCSDALVPPHLCVPPHLLREAEAADASADVAPVAPESYATSPASEQTYAAPGVAEAATMGAFAAAATAAAASSATQEGVSMPESGAALRRLFCALDAAQARLDRSRRSRLRLRRPVIEAARALREAEGRAGCRLGRAPSDEALLRRTAAESDVVGCGGVRFARLVPLNASTTASAVNEGVALELDCPAWRLPYYSLDLSPVLHPYTGSPVLLPPQVEYVVAYCRYPEASPPACDRVGREGKPSNAAVLRRACPRLSHGWVTQPLVRFVPSAGVYQRAKRVALARPAALATSAGRGDGKGVDKGGGGDVGGGGGGPGGLGLNVLVLMLDSVSSERFASGMPLTRALLESWATPSAAAAAGQAATQSDGWRAFRYERFAVVGSNSPRNQFPLLSGYGSLEYARDHGGLALDCIVPGFPDTRAPTNHSCHRWVFDSYREAGYTTMFGTNMCDWGVMEEVYPFDTAAAPTDHHLMQPWCHVDYDVDKLYFRPVSRCFGPVPAHEPLLTYESQFLAAYEGARRLSWTVYLEGHEPSFRVMGSLDAALAAHLLALRARHGHDTAIFLVSDHGIHYGTFYDGSPSGPREHATPLLYALLPRRTLAAWPQLEGALSANRRRLFSPFDLHATLLHLLSYPHPPRLPDWSTAAIPLRAKSILQPLPRDRECEDAGIPASICPCLQHASTDT